MLVLSVSLAGAPFGGKTAVALEYSYDNCPEIMDVYLQWRTVEILSYLDLYFESKENTSSMVNGALEAYRQYKRAINAELSKFKVSPALTEEQFKSFDMCLRLVDQYTEQARDKLKEKIVTNGKIKQSTLLLEKYQAINGGLSNMNLKIARIVSAFQTFKNKLPGFLRDCITK